MLQMYFRSLIKHIIFENLYFKIFQPKMCIIFDQLFGFLCSALCFPMLSSLYSLISSFRELIRECKELSMGKQRAEHGRPKSWAKNTLEYKFVCFILNLNICGAYYAYIIFMVHIHFKVVVDFSFFSICFFFCCELNCFSLYFF